MRLFHLLWLSILWLNMDKSLQQNACPNPEIQHGFAVGPYNDTLYYTCDEGFKLLNKGWWAEAKCHDGVWHGLDKCIAKSIESNWCNPPLKIDNAVVIAPYQSEYLPDSAVTYQCRDEYTIKGEDTIRCIGGKWEEKNIVCTSDLSCGIPPPLENGDIKTTVQLEYRHNDFIEYVCQPYYTIETQTYKICKNGEWIGQIRCRKPCTVDREAMNAHNIEFRYKRDDKAVFIPQ
ncbi:complement factor H-related protein 1-like [Plectropomus leopardus]|uniref:complement factor H-related protein 1-like n=1 Tax=Plectropomus leopardus TaxID=160734 RepID=UPI001C4BDF02|nr:complement factor H-related protein 1-like [Plectropomus leopardus]